MLLAFESPIFPNPVLVVDTSTVEGRALSMITFDTNGLKSEWRDYEYVVNCILDN